MKKKIAIHRAETVPIDAPKKPRRMATSISGLFVIRGAGRPKYAFASGDEYVAKIKAALAETYLVLSTEQVVGITGADGKHLMTLRMASQTNPSDAPTTPASVEVAPAPAAGIALTSSEFGAVDAMTRALARQNANGMVEAFIDPLREAFSWASKPSTRKDQRKFLPIKPQMKSLLWHVNKLEELNKHVLQDEYLWKTAVGLFGQVAPPDKLLGLIQSLFEQLLADLLFTLSRFAAYVRQERAGKFDKSARAIELYCAETAREVLKGLELYCQRTGIKIPEANLPFIKGNFWAALVNDESLATLPADPNGPIGLELVLPSRMVVGPNGEEETGTLMNAFPAFGHEMFHQFNAGTDFLLVMIKLIQSVYMALIKAGKLKPTQETVTIGADPKTAIQVPTIAILLSMFTQESELNEQSSDKFMLLRHALGGQTSLQRYFKSIMNYELQLSTFDRGDIPNNGSYKIDEDQLAKGILKIELPPHQPMWERIEADSVELDMLGMFKEGEFSRESLLQQNGGVFPEYVVFHGDQGAIKIPTLDVVAFELVATRVILNGPIPSLGGACLRDIMDWTPEVQTLVDETIAMVAGDGELVLPKFEFPTRIIVSACPLATRVLIDRGMNPQDAHAKVEKRGLALMTMAVAANEKAQKPTRKTPRKRTKTSKKS